MTITFCPVTKEPIFDDPSEFLVNTDHFRAGDLDLFIESMEIISRFERERCEERKRKREERVKERKDQREFSAMVTAAEAQIDEQIAADETLMQQMELKSVSDDETDEEVAAELVDENDNTLIEESEKPYKKKPKSNSKQVSFSKEPPIVKYFEKDSIEDVKVANVATLPLSLEEKVSPSRPRSYVIGKEKKGFSTRSRIIGMAVKRQRDKQSIVIPSTDLSKEEIALAVKRCEEALAEIQTQKYQHLSRKGCAALSMETTGQDQSFLTQALRLLTF